MTTKQRRRNTNERGPSFPYLDIARKGTSDTQLPSTADLRVDSGAENGKVE